MVIVSPVRNRHLSRACEDGVCHAGHVEAVRRLFVLQLCSKQFWRHTQEVRRYAPLRRDCVPSRRGHDRRLARRVQPAGRYFRKLDRSQRQCFFHSRSRFHWHSDGRLPAPLRENNRHALYQSRESASRPEPRLSRTPSERVQLLRSMGNDDKVRHALPDPTKDADFHLSSYPRGLSPRFAPALEFHKRRRSALWRSAYLCAKCRWYCRK